MGLHLALVHHPIRNKAGDLIATNVTHFDIHDISRVCKTYGLKSYQIIHPNLEQLAYVERIKAHWVSGYGQNFNKKRGQALEILKTAGSISEVLKSLDSPYVISTSARSNESFPKTLSFEGLKTKIEEESEKRDLLLLMGTGFGLSDQTIIESDALLEPIVTKSGFNHLSVRVCAGIILDRLLG